MFYNIFFINSERQNMSEESVSSVKNSIKRNLSRIISKSPTSKERKEIILFFDNKCAYCGKDLSNEKGHLDHLITYDNYFINDKYNRVLACLKCNSYEKRDKKWDVFLEEKCGGKNKTYFERKTKIENWINNKTEDVPQELIEKCIEINNEIVSAFIKGHEKLEKYAEKINGIDRS